MIRHYILDTNILIAEKRSLGNLVDKLKGDNGDVYITDVSVQELKGQNAREIKDGIVKIENVKRGPIGQYLDFTHNIDQDKAIKQSNKRIDEYLNSIFGKNIIPAYVNGLKVQNLLNRANDKVAPFNIESKSDKGFKDTILWLSIIEYYKSKTDIEIKLVTNDGVFKKQEKDLHDEFYKETSLEIEVINGSNIPVSKKDNFTESISKDQPVLEIDLDEIENVIEDFRYTSDIDTFGNTYMNRNFKVHKLMDYDDTKNFLENLKILMSTKYALFKRVNLSSVFNTIGVKAFVINEINSSTCNRLVNLYEKVKNGSDVYYDSFIELMMGKMNNFYEVIEESDIYLPF